MKATFPKKSGPLLRFVGDESLDYAVIEALRSLGHQVVAVAHEASGLSDSAVVEMARTMDAIILTADKDFGCLVFGQGAACRGVVLFRLSELSSLKMAERALQAWQASGDQWIDSFTVVQAQKLRNRPLPNLKSDRA